MRLDVGHRLGPYEVLSILGSGGMGEVYRARDARLGREVAIKVLPAERVSDENRRRRFVQEARAVSALSHPSIVTLYEIETAEGIDFIVMEYVRGRTLDELLRPRLKVAEALRLAIPIADALAAAHAAGIVHRDLKPKNVMVTPEGGIKVLDFGLAKLISSNGTSDDEDTASESQSDRVSSEPGAIAGTPGYMAPEQVRGGPVDPRSDIFAFGSLLYEMVTGQRAFGGNSRAEKLAAVLHHTPAIPSSVAPEVPRDLDKVILRCLQKEPDRRFQHVADVKVELQEIGHDLGEPASRPQAGPWRRGSWGLAVALLLAAVVVGVTRPWREPAAVPRVVPLTTSQGDEGWATFSPDGNQIAFVWDPDSSSPARSNYDIWLKIIGSSETRRLTSDPAADQFPAWSPDGRHIAFLRFKPGAPFATLHVVSPLGGAERRVGDVPAGRSPIAWTPDGRWLVFRRARLPQDTTPGANGLTLVPVAAGEPRALTHPEAPGFHTGPAFSRAGGQLAYSSCASAVFPPCDLYVVDVGPDHAPVGPARRLTRQAAGIAGLAWGRDDRSIVYSTAHVGLDRARLWRVGVAGGVPERLEIAPAGAIAPALAAAQDRLAFTQTTNDVDVHRFVPERASSPVLVSSLPDYAPTFSPDGKRIAFESGRSGEQEEIWLADADGSNPVQLTHGPGVWQGTPRFSPDGRRVVFESRGEDGFGDIWVIDVDGGMPRRLTDGRFTNAFASFSRDGQKVYFRDDHADGRDISRVPAEGGTPERLTRNGGVLARESPDGRSLFYTQQEPTSPIFRLDLADRSARQVVDCAQGRSLADGPDGMYYLGCDKEGDEFPLYRFDVEKERSQRLGYVAWGRGNVGIAVSPDARTILFVKAVDRGADLVLVENFR